MARGIIAAPIVFGGGEFDVIFDRTISLEDVRYYALYWDKVVIPDNPHISIKIPNQDILIETGVISRPAPPRTGQMLSGAISRAILESQLKIARDLVQNEAGTDWTLHQFGGNLVLPTEFAIDARTVRVELQKILPVPVADIPIIDILEFKERRKTELEALHQHLDECYLEILRSPDPSLEAHAAVTRLKKSIADLDTVATEKWKITKKFDLSVDLNIDGAKLALGVASAAAFDFYTQSGLHLPMSSVVGGLLSLIKISAKKTATFEAAKNNLKLSYLSHAQSGSIL